VTVSSHLGIALSEYDARIRTFIPDYSSMLDAAVSALEGATRPLRVVLDLGIGSGALAWRCAQVQPQARLVGIDTDAGMLALARRRLRGVPTVLVHKDLARAAFPRCDAITASFALHHIRTKRQKATLYARAFAALSPGGVFVNADCCPASNGRLHARDRAAWRAHLERSYSRRAAEAFLRAWAREDVYFTLDAEVAMLQAAGFRPDIAWRQGAFAVVAAYRPSRR
jgi:tRNA (cmo5U34)-methyltransferase